MGLFMSALLMAMQLAKEFEGCKTHAYFDEYGKVFTVGYGCTGAEINEHTVWTQDQCEANLAERMQNALDHALNLSPFLKHMSEGRQAAIADFIYNLGMGAYSRSTLKLMVDNNNWDGAKKEILLWNKANGKVLDGLTRRRKAEANLI